MALISICRRKPALVLILAAVIVACGDPLGSTAGPDAAQVLVGSGASTTRADPAEILTTTIDGDDLRLQLRYGGGCVEHDFSLLHFGLFMESHPVQTRLTLAHDAHGDVCRALLTREVTFDLSPVRSAYQEAYSQHGEILIHLHAPGSPNASAQTVRYLF